MFWKAKERTARGKFCSQTLLAKRLKMEKGRRKSMGIGRVEKRGQPTHIVEASQILQLAPEFDGLPGHDAYDAYWIARKAKKSGKTPMEAHGLITKHYPSSKVSARHVNDWFDSPIENMPRAVEGVTKLSGAFPLTTTRLARDLRPLARLAAYLRVSGINSTRHGRHHITFHAAHETEREFVTKNLKALAKVPDISFQWRQKVGGMEIYGRNAWALGALFHQLGARQGRMARKTGESRPLADIAAPAHVKWALLEVERSGKRNSTHTAILEDWLYTLLRKGKLLKGGRIRVILPRAATEQEAQMLADGVSKAAHALGLLPTGGGSLHLISPKKGGIYSKATVAVSGDALVGSSELQQVVLELARNKKAA